MQTMIDLCDVFSADFDVKFNTAKTVAMRIGPRFDAVCLVVLCSMCSL